MSTSKSQNKTDHANKVNLSPSLHYFVTGTDTEVGKTLVACALIRGLQKKWPHRRVSGFKPVVAGTYQDQEGQRVNEDLLSLISAGNLGQSMHDICPYILDTPAAPHLVAKDIAIEMQVSTILRLLQVILDECDQVVMEGAGGFLVPLNKEESLSDLAQLLNWPVIVVVGLRLGCLNHALCTLEAIKSRGLKVTGWVANTIDPQMSYLDENLADLQMRIPEPFLGQIPYLPDSLKKADHAPYSSHAMDWAISHLNMDLL
jgi:dethiobiotin synthetase